MLADLAFLLFSVVVACADGAVLFAGGALCAVTIAVLCLDGEGR